MSDLTWNDFKVFLYTCLISLNLLLHLMLLTLRMQGPSVPRVIQKLACCSAFLYCVPPSSFCLLLPLTLPRCSPPCPRFPLRLSLVDDLMSRVPIGLWCLNPDVSDVDFLQPCPFLSQSLHFCCFPGCMNDVFSFGSLVENVLYCIVTSKST